MAQGRSTLTRREFLGYGVGVAAGVGLLGPLGRLALAGGQPPKPNILFVFADQMREASLGCIGCPDVHTPNLDRLAEQGLLFTDAISNYPVCTPYRASLLTGRYATTTGVAANGVELPDSEVTIAEVLKTHGYKTGYIGKWHLEKNNLPFVPKSRRQGFDYWAVRNNGGPHWDSFYCMDTEDPVPMKGYVPDAATDLAVGFLEKNAKDPFCLFLSWGAPHPPYDPPKQFADMYDPAKLKQRPNVKGDAYRENLAKYYGAITAIDADIGKLTAALDRLGIANDTIICFTSDHGDMMGSQGRIGKNVPWEESINVPFIIRYPRAVKAGGRSNALISSVDIMPTLLGLCGIAAPKGVQGADLSRTVLGKPGKTPESVLLQRVIAGKDPESGVREWRGVRTARHTYARGKDKAWLLYDNEKDPYQTNNLAGKPEAQAVEKKLDTQLQGWLKKIGDDFASADEWRKRVQGHASRRLSIEE